jgi:hypothetical protein
MIQHQTSPQNEPMVRVNATHLSTRNHMALSPPLTLATDDWSHDVINYHGSTVTLVSDSFSRTMSSPAVPTLDPDCKFNSAVCYADNDVITWNIPRNDSCQLVKHRANDCMLTGNQLVCPSLAISVGDYH